MGTLTLEWGRRTYVMGVLNVTPDSFSGDGVMDLAAAAARGGQMLADGADIILIPLGAGLFDLCLLSWISGGPVQGRRVRALHRN